MGPAPTDLGSPYVYPFLHPSCEDRELVGGKAVNLALLSRAGLRVPSGFTITTSAYASSVASAGIAEEILSRAAGLRYDDAVTLEARTGEIRDLILRAPIAADVSDAIVKAHGELVGGGYVAVRSSAVAEDLQDASFAGLHDTFLDVRGSDDVLDAVRRCWASLWTARCAKYRHDAGIGHERAQIAVVIQEMVPAEASGVLFTANPINGLTSEFVINASYGLGEGVVSGILTPDEYVVAADNFRLTKRTLGAKECEVVRHSSGRGTEVRDVDGVRRGRFVLGSEQAADLARLGAEVMRLYDGFPQDIEWARVGDTWYILQTRAVTGVQFLWDEDMDAWQFGHDDSETVWTHTWAEAYWTGAITPLFYSIRARELRDTDERMFKLWGFDDLAGMRRYKYRRSTMYYSSTADRLFYRYIVPRRLRATSVANLPPSWREEAVRARFDWFKALKMHARIKLLAGKRHGPLKFFEETYRWIAEKEESNGPTSAQLREMSDAELKAAARRAINRFREFNEIPRTGFWVYSPTAFGALQLMLSRWYRGSNSFAFQEIISGLPRRTAMLEESIQLWRLGQKISASKELSELLDTHKGADFFTACEDVAVGRDFLADYRAFVEEWAHRGHADRDIYYPRRSEDPSLDYRAFRMLLGDSTSPEEMERRLVQQREAATAEVLGDIRGRRFGRLKAWVFQRMLDYALRFLVLRDDQREQNDRHTMAKKRAFVEVGRRLLERGLIEREDDFYFLCEDDVWALFGGEHLPLAPVKIANRRQVFELVKERKEVAPPYLVGNEPMAFDDGVEPEGDGGFSGTALSRGTVTGTARVIPRLEDIGRLHKGDILVCNATDPGWASVFNLIGGLVMETGGMLAHGACLSREYGLPAVTLPRALHRITDGSVITVVGDSGTVHVLEAAAGDDRDEDRPAMEPA
jgi:rifampicin phosphotransferase